MAEVFLLGGAAETALGPFEGNLFGALCAGRTGAAPVTRFDVSRLHSRTSACITVPARERRTGENLTQALLRRILPRLAAFPPVQTIIWAGVKGNAEFVESGEKEDCPFPYLPRHYSLWIRDQLGFPRAALLEVGAACASSTLGLALGADLIASGRSASVLVIAADIVSRFSFVGFCALGAMTPSACRPFDIARDGLILGDGAGGVLLAGKNYMRDSGMSPLARLSGWGIANDANHITAPARDGRGLIAAARAALKLSGRGAEGIGAFCAHGTGTVYNDAMELTAMEVLFGDRRLPVFSVKGALGHTLGAAGCIEILVCARALAEGVVPPTAGLLSPEPRAIGRLRDHAQKFDAGAILKTNSGFGGINAALVLERPEGTAP